MNTAFRLLTAILLAAVLPSAAPLPPSEAQEKTAAQENAWWSAEVDQAFMPMAGQEKKPAKALKHMEADLGGGVKMKFVFIEPGKFMMGSPKEEKERLDCEFQHDVEITKGMWMGVFEVTQLEYEKVTGKNPSFFKGERLPAEQVSWEDAMEFCKQLTRKEAKKFDLPTEAEWEYACRAGGKGVFHYGESLSSKQANFLGHIPYGGAEKGPVLLKTAPVGSYQPNDFGLYDMHGNVWEWCKDWWNYDYYMESPLRDPPGPRTGTGGSRPDSHPLRGGSFFNSAADCRSAGRNHSGPDYRGQNSGFRVVVRLP